VLLLSPREMRNDVGIEGRVPREDVLANQIANMVSCMPGKWRTSAFRPPIEKCSPRQSTNSQACQVGFSKYDGWKRPETQTFAFKRHMGMKNARAQPLNWNYLEGVLPIGSFHLWQFEPFCTFSLPCRRIFWSANSRHSYP